jgi:hypothetical protein
MAALRSATPIDAVTLTSLPGTVTAAMAVRRRSDAPTPAPRPVPRSRTANTSPP